jgi:branched-subunit amino acid aminotransferase/4-amino-4-deoxychorismate lyase
MTDFLLFETMRVSETREVPLLERHLERMQSSAQYFSFKFDLRRLRETVLAVVPSAPQPSRLRLTLAPDGTAELEQGPLPASFPRALLLSTLRVSSSDPFLCHKTTRRDIFEQARRDCDENLDAVFTNERSELTETTIANIAVFRDSCWLTPPATCGLLPGVMRAELLARGEIVEGVIPAHEIRSGEVVRCFNALRGVWDAEILRR